MEFAAYENHLYVAIGAILLWGKLGHEGRKAFVLEDLLAAMRMPSHICTILGFVIFVTLGVFVAIGVVKPTSAAQAIVAGMGWTGMLSKPAKEPTPPTDVH